MFVGRHLVQVDTNGILHRDVSVVLIIIMAGNLLVICGAVRKECQVPARLLVVGMDGEGAGLDAVVPLDALLLPLVDSNAPSELELGVALTARAAPGGGGGPAPATDAHTLFPLSGPRHPLVCENCCGL